MDAYMPRRRTTLILEDDTYTKLVNESLRRYGTPRALSKVIDAMVEESTTMSAKKKEQSLLRLLYSRKVAKTTSKEFERDRRELSKRFEQVESNS